MSLDTTKSGFITDTKGNRAEIVDRKARLAVNEMSNCSSTVTKHQITSWVVGSCYASTGYASTPSYRSYSAFIYNDGRDIYFDSSKYKLMITYWKNTEQSSRTSISPSWSTKSPAKLDSSKTDYVRLQLESLDRSTIVTSDIDVYYNTIAYSSIVKKVLTAESNLKELMKEDYPVIDGLSGFDKNDGIPSSSNGNYYINVVGSNASDYAHIVVPVHPCEEIIITADSEYSCIFAGVTEYTPPKDSNTNPCYFSECSGWTRRKEINKGETFKAIIPIDVRYIIIVKLYRGDNITPSVFKVYKHQVNWCAMGDSITEGYVSYRDSNGSRTSLIDPSKGWASYVSAINEWKLDNKGIGGTGWNKATNEEVSAGVDTTSAHYLARHTDFKPYDIVTLAFGINDWKGNRETGTLSDNTTTPTTTIGGMKATIEAIIASNPHCKIIVILPLNCLGYYSSGESKKDDPIPSYGTKDTNWGLGYRFSESGTLEEFVQKMIEVCDYYGVQYIDQTHYSCINRINIKNCLDDGVHPNLKTHKLLGMELSGKLTFG